ncbi:MAG: (d)CMP kinase [Candidatus Dependentiae bacterium]
MIITIDGPSASGKSTVAREVARKINFYYLASGLLFRAFAYIASKHGMYDHDALLHSSDEKIKEIINSERLVYKYENGHEQVFYEGQDITPNLKTNLIDQYASIGAQDQRVRQAIDEYMRNLAQSHNVVTEGRDMGTTVFPHAEFKFFLTASDEVRVKRWQKDQAHKGIHYSYDQAYVEVIERDKRDQMREFSPLACPKDACVIDNSNLTIEQTVEKIIAHIT